MKRFLLILAMAGSAGLAAATSSLADNLGTGAPPLALGPQGAPGISLLEDARAPNIVLAQSIASNRGLFGSRAASPRSAPMRYQPAPRGFDSRPYRTPPPLYGAPRATPRSSVRRPAPRTARAPATRPAPRRRDIDPAFMPTVVTYDGPHAPGTIIIDTPERYLYLVGSNGKARRYGVGVGRPGFQWAGAHKITRKAEWPDWRPPAEMRQRQPSLPAFMPGGPRNPLGARALYLGSTLYRIHGSNEPWTIGRAVSSGCIRMRNEDVEDLYARVDVGTKVIVR